MSDFKPGDKVTTELGERVVRFGPFRTVLDENVYLIERPDGVHVTSRASKLRPADPRREVVIQGLNEARKHGFSGTEKDFVARMADAVLKALDAAEPAPLKVGDRVRVLYAKYAEDTHGRVGVLRSVDENWRIGGDLHQYTVALDDGASIHARDVERV